GDPSKMNVTETDKARRATPRSVLVGDPPKMNVTDKFVLPDQSVMKRRLEVVKLLIEHGANVKATTRQGATPLHVAASKEIVELLIQHGAIVDAQSLNEERLTPLFIATGKHKSVAEALIDHGANVNQRSTSGDTPLLAAARNGNLEVVKLLI